MHMMFRKVAAGLTAYVLLLLPVAGQQTQAPDPILQRLRKIKNFRKNRNRK